MLENIFDKNLFYFFANLAITYGIVQNIVKRNDTRNWAKFRHNYSQNLFERTEELLDIFQDNIEAFKPFRSSDESLSTAISGRHYNLDVGTTLRKFGSQVTVKRNEIRQSMELGFVGISGELSNTISDFQECLEDLTDLISYLLQFDDVTGLQELTERERDKLSQLLSEFVHSDGSVKVKLLRNNLLKCEERIYGPFSEMRLYITNLSGSVGYASKVKKAKKPSNLKGTIAAMETSDLDEEVLSKVKFGIRRKNKTEIDALQNKNSNVQKNKSLGHINYNSMNDVQKRISVNKAQMDGPALRYLEYSKASIDLDKKLQEICGSYLAQLSK